MAQAILKDFNQLNVPLARFPRQIFWNMATLVDLPTDIAHLLFCRLGIPDVLNMRQTCKNMHSISQSRVVWQFLLTSLAKQQRPIPRLFDRSFDSLSPAELEHLTRKAWNLRQNWMTKSPVVKKTLIIQLEPLPNQGGLPPTFEFMEKTGKRHILTLMMKGPMPEGFLYDLQCWDLDVSPPRCIAQREVGSRYLTVNKSLDSLASLVVQSPSIEFLGIDYSAEDPVSGFYTVSKLQNITQRPVAFNDSFLVTQNDQSQLYLVQLQKNNDDHIELRSSQPMLEAVFEVMIQNEVVIVIRRRILEIFSVGDINTSQMLIYPIAQHVFQWDIDSVSISPQTTWPQCLEHRYPTINLLIRFGSLLPWPVNLLHHFVLLPNPGFDGELHPSSNNLPYSDTPIVKRTISSPVRLFSKYHMALGSRGTAIFIDSHTEDYFHRGDVGQRLAGSYARDVSSVENDVEDSTEVESTMDSSVFGYRENDDWTRVAIDEEEGRIALGFLDGTIEIREYA
ncbi:hypothetical protein E4T56_gene20687 [Termitomyces sp. T112]|nr:hypothetical protein E4T56_gene20687 [Termitomyces sp. T112]